jgi:hypothetical protein
MLECSHFLAGYSDYRDGVLDAEWSESFRSHMEQCDSCARYDRVVGGGVDLLLGRGEIEPSEDFALRLQGRLLSLEKEMETQRSTSGASAAVTFVVALALGVAAWAPTLRRSPSPAVLQPVLAHAPRHPQVVPSPFQSRPVLPTPEVGPLRVRNAVFSSYLGDMTGPALASPTLATYPLVRH